MKYIVLLFFLFLIREQDLKAQSIFFKTGGNLTKYVFDNYSNAVTNLQSETGKNYGLGFMSKQANKQVFYYTLSAGLEEYNASGFYANNNLVWETLYVNLKGLGYISLFNNSKNQISLKQGLGLATLVHGRQQINEVRSDLLKENEFKGLFIDLQAGLSYNLTIIKDICFSVDYDYGHQYNLSNKSEQKLSFINHSLSFGFGINIK